VSKLFDFEKMDEFDVPCKESGETIFVSTREPHKVTSKLIPTWCKGVVVHRPTHIKEPNNWVVSDIITHTTLPIKESTQMKEAVMRASALLREKGEESYKKALQEVRGWLGDACDDPRLGFDLLNSNKEE